MSGKQDSGLILASASPARISLLQQAGIKFAHEAAGVDEASLKQAASQGKMSQEATCLALAEAKALTVSARYPGKYILGADSLVSLGEMFLDKPGDAKRAYLHLIALRGKTHSLSSGVVLAKDGKTLWQHVETAYLSMRDFSDDYLKDYLAQEGEAVAHCVGAYRLEGLGIQLFSKIHGDYFTILGLPLLPVLAALRSHGVMAT